MDGICNVQRGEKIRGTWRNFYINEEKDVQKGDVVWMDRECCDAGSPKSVAEYLTQEFRKATGDDKLTVVVDSNYTPKDGGNIRAYISKPVVPQYAVDMKQKFLATLKA